MSKRILIIDDDEAFGKLIKTTLELRGDYNVDTSTDGMKGIEIAKMIRPDLILLDILMPRMDGFEVLKALKEDEDTMSIPVVMLTAIEGDESKEKAAESYNEDYVIKPIEIVDLIKKIEEVLKRRGVS